MSEPKLISPLLDGFAMGDPISSHDGVRCCPAMQDDSDKKYIVKIISVPASQTQLDALLLTGAYPSAEAAQGYFHDLADGILKETEILSKLATAGGFLPYEGCQCVPMESGVGYNVYLLGPYRRSLARQFRREPLTHLGAVNMGIDLCAALAVCRRAGYLYVDLKPGNVFLEEQGYRIGDIGFVPMDSLKYVSMPTRCRGSWTAPEVQDALATLNPTVDIYALGLLLYQAYNNGTLPFEGMAPDEPLPPPMYADYEMAEIILKACAPKPEDRWQEPAQMGQALVAYMQRNEVNDTPIIPPKVAEPEYAPEDAPEAEASEETAPAADASEETAPAADATPGDQPDEESDELRFIRELVSDETAPSDESAEGLSDAALTEEGSDILAQAEELIAHEAPGPAVAPEAPEIPMPEPIVDPEAIQTGEGDEAPGEADWDGNLPTDEELAQRKQQSRARTKKILKRVLVTAVCLLLVAGLAFGVWYFYTGYYLQEVTDVVLDGSEDTLTVRITSGIDDSLLTVNLTDTFGNLRQAQVSGGTARFTELNPNSQYTVELVISGLHKLTGTTTYAYSTQARTNIVSFYATAGAEDGSVILNFTVDGQDADQWTIGYAAYGEDEQFTTFDGHMVTISGLTVGSTYTFRLVPTSEIYLVGSDRLEYTAVKVVQAENLAVTACDESNLTAAWTAPADAQVESWSVRCYNDAGYDETLTTGELTATFTGIDSTTAHTVEVTAQGMTVCARTYVTANPITITSIHGNNTDPLQMVLTWDFTGPAPEGGWLLMYTIDGADDPQVIKCPEASAIVTPKVPGSHYAFTLQAASGASVFGGSFSADTPEAETFVGYDVSADNMEFRMCRRPEVEDWTRDDLEDTDYTTEFTAEDQASFSVHLNKEYNVSYDDIVTTFIIRDAEGHVVSADSETRAWAEMWNRGYCEIDVPALPLQAGSYTLEIYFNGAAVTTQEFTIAD